MEGRCTECNCHNVALHHYHKDLCYDCYEKMYYKQFPIKKIDLDEEPDFELKSEIANVQSAVDSGKLVYTGTNHHYLTINNPKRMVFNPDCRVKDFDKLILFLLENMTIYENARGFDKVRYMFKEDDK